MKKFLSILAFSFYFSFAMFAQHPSKLTKSDAWIIVQNELLDSLLDNVSVFVSSSFIESNSRISTISIFEDYAPEFDNWFFFIDDHPFDSWSHSCRYVFVNIENGMLVVQNKQHPPLLNNMEPMIEQKRNNVNLSSFKFSNKRFNRSLEQSSYSANHDYAVIISGGYEPYYNWERYWNHCSSLYQALIDIYGYSKDHIYVLMSDGTSPGLDRHMIDGTYTSSPLDLDGDEIADVQYSATRSDINLVFNTLSSILTNQDNLFIFTTDHGTQINGQQVCLNLWNHEVLYDYEFASIISSLNANIINICMVQCHSGGFIDDISQNNVVISTSCKYDESAYARNDLLYSEFVYHWLSGIAGETPDGYPVNADSNNDGFVSIHEAFLYAKTHDTKNETPQYSSVPLTMGDALCLSHIDPIIVGQDVICDTATYSINNMLQGYSVLWSIDNSNFSISSSGNLCFVTYTGTPQYSVANLTATVSWSGTTIKTLTKRIVMHGSDLYVTGWQYGGLITPNGTYPDREFTIPANNGLILSRTKPDRLSMDDIFGKDKKSLPINFTRDLTLVNPDLPPFDVCGYGITEINGGNTVCLNSTRFDGMDISFSSAHSPTSYYHNEDYIAFELPYSNDVYYTKLFAESDSQCHDFCLMFKVVPLPGAASGDDIIWVNLSGSMLYITYEGAIGTPIGNGQYYNPPYTVTISQIPSGTQVYSNTFPGGQTEFSVNTSSWTSGIYSIRIVQGNNVYTKSIYL
jgi:hypothetical protein